MAKYTVVQIKDLLEIHENTLLKIFNEKFEKLESKLVNLQNENTCLKKEVYELKKSVEFVSEKYEAVNIKLTEQKNAKTSTVANINSTTSFENENNNEIKDKIAELEDRSRRSNLRFSGIVEDENETWEKENLNIFNLICLTETWCDSVDVKLNSNLCLTGFNMIPLARKAKKRGGGVLIYIKENMCFIIRPDMSISDDNIEVLTIEIKTGNSKNILLSCCYRPPSSKTESFASFLCNDILKKGLKGKKFNYLIGDVNLNCFEYHTNNNIKKFYDNLFQNGAVPLISRSTRVTATSASIIDNIITTDIFNKFLKIGIIKNEISDHFPIFFSINIVPKLLPQQKQIFTKRFFNETSLKSFNEQLSLIRWTNIDFKSDANIVYDTFYKTFFDIYDANFPKKEICKSNKSLKSPWINKDIRKSSKIKQKLYVEYLKTKTHESKILYKKYAKQFESQKKAAKKNYYLNMLEKHKFNSKRTWQILAEITGNRKLKLCSLPKSLKINGNNVDDPKEIASELNKFFVSVGPNLSKNIPDMLNPIINCVLPLKTNLNAFEVSFSEFESAFKLLKSNKAVGPDDISGNIVISSDNNIKDILFKVFKCSINQGIFPEQLKVAKVTPIFKGGELKNVNNYRPISVLSVFSKIFERI
ncbi:uncharacterized protein LOC136082563 [Hydra vulgaris]|uniref:Uncharacterized protein LOC136082563 n=1 Tax=Hydra vulgaris TaxID=6087 RepID=A0ABM4C8T6_HYDVU